MKFVLDRSLLLTIIFLMGLGVVQVYSSSFIFATEAFGDGHHFFKRQFFFAVLGLVIILATTYFPSKWIEKFGYMIWFLASLGIALTLVPGLGVKAGGASRWVQLPIGLRFEPGELLKIGLPLLMATFIARDEKFWGPYLGLLKWPLRFTLILVPFFLLLQQPDFGTIVICTLVLLTMLFTYGLKWRYIFVSLVALIPTFYFLVITKPYRYARIMAFLDPWDDPSQKGFQVIQSMLSFHSGGLWGVGLGQGQGKLFFLPEAHSDFTLAILGEEMGFIGFMVVILLFGFIVYRGMQISMQSVTRFHQALALGITLIFSFSVFINVGVVLGFLPTKGLTLPFLSYGGSSLVCTCFSLGLLLNIDRMNRFRQINSKYYKI